MTITFVKNYSNKYDPDLGEYPIYIDYHNSYASDDSLNPQEIMNIFEDLPESKKKKIIAGISNYDLKI